MSKDQGSKPSMYLKLHTLPIAVHLGEPHDVTIEKSSAHFICEEFGLLFEFGYHRFAFSLFFKCLQVFVVLEFNIIST